MFELKVLTPKGEIFVGAVDSVNIPTTAGHAGILAYHENFIASLTTGKIEIYANDKKNDLICKSGFVRAENNIVEILVEEAVMANDLMMEKVKEAEKKAHEETQRTDITASDLIRLEKALRYEKFKREYLETQGM